MKKTLQNLAFVGAVLGTGVLGGCADKSRSVQALTNPVQPTTYSEPKSPFPKGHVTGYDFKDKTQEDTPYNLERAVFYGDQFYAQAKPTDNQNELGFAFYRFEDVTREVDADTGNVKLVTDTKYVPTRVTSNCTDDSGDQCYVDKLTLSSRPSKVGDKTIPGIRVKIKRINVKEINDFIGSSYKTSQDDASYNIRTTMIAGEEYFFPRVPKSKTNDSGKLPFYLVPKTGAQLRIKNANGEITISGDVYRPIEFKLPKEKVINPVTSGTAVPQTSNKRFRVLQNNQ